MVRQLTIDLPALADTDSDSIHKPVTLSVSVNHLPPVGDASVSTPTQFLEPTDIWLEKYKPGKLRRKRVDVYAGMAGFS